MTAQFCGHCGQPANRSDHERCTKAMALEPPRYCRSCRRRMVVQITPLGWTAKCSRHGVTSA